MKTQNIIQYIIGIAIFTIFFISLFVGIKDYYQILILLILIQLIISLGSGKIINFIFEIGLLILALIISIPILFSSFKAIAFILAILVFIFKLIALPLAWIDFSIFRGFTYHQNIKFVNKFETLSTKKEKKSSKKKPKFTEAEFEEK